MLIAQKSGVVRVAVGNTLIETPFIDISGDVNNIRDRGLLDIAVHPKFSENPYVYLLFTYEGVAPDKNPFSDGLAGPDGIGNRAGRLIRVTADENNAYHTAVENSTEILLGKNSTRDYFNATVDSTEDFNEPPGGEFSDGTHVQDFINSDSQSHSIGGLAFSPSGDALYVSTGDGASYNRVDVRAKRCQDKDSLTGKILRIDPVTGQGLPGNPYFFEDDPQANRAKVFQMGVRNAFRIAMNKTTGTLYIGEVGWYSWEEVNAGPPGANFGWPFYEGGFGSSLVQGEYANTDEGIAFFDNGPPENLTSPIYALTHFADGVSAIILGDTLNSTYYGSDLQGTLLFSEFNTGIVRYMTFDGEGKVARTGVFALDASYFVKIVQGPDGKLYYCALVNNKVGRWDLN
jgi:glucose/arabinose dehydrogenase